MFVPGKSFKPCLIFASKPEPTQIEYLTVAQLEDMLLCLIFVSNAGAYPIGAPFT